MKKINYVIGLFLIALIGFGACKKVSDISTLLGKMSAKIDGTSWSVSATDVSGGLSGVAALKSDSKFLVTGIDANGKTISVFIAGSKAGQDYDLAPLAGGSSAASLYKTSSEADSTGIYVSISGTVNLSEVTDKRLSGTFSFKSKNISNEEVDITNGSFENVLYTSVDSLDNQ